MTVPVEQGDAVELTQLTLHLDENDSADEEPAMSPAEVEQTLASIAVDAPPAATVKKVIPVQQENREQRTGFLGKLIFSYLGPLLYVGKTRPLHENDVDEINEDDSVQANIVAFEEYWRVEVAAGREPSVLTYAAKSQWLEILWIVLLIGASSFGGVVTPFLLEAIIVWVEDVDRDTFTGWYLAFILFAVSYMLNFFFAHGTNISNRLDARVRGWLASAIFRKSLRVRSISEKTEEKETDKTGASADASADAADAPVEGKEETKDQASGGVTTGQIVNLMSGDAGTVALLPMSIANIIIVPAQVSILIWLLWEVMGDSVFFGLLLIFGIFPMVGGLFYFFIKYESARAKTSDTRIKLTNEVLQGIRLVKFYGWENNFFEELYKVRDVELDWIFKLTFLSTGWGFIFVVFPVALITLSFGSYVWNGGELTVVLAFKALALFQALTWPLVSLPSSISGLLMAMVAGRRVNTFLLQEELDRTHILEAKTPEEKENFAQYPLQIRDGTFGWSAGKQKDATTAETAPVAAAESVEAAEDVAKADFTLQDINFRAEKGKLTAIVGSVGSGKSSLVAALLNEMPCQGGNIVQNGSLSYVTQEAWIQNGTVKDNILFGKEMNRPLYEQTIDVCSFRDDLQTLPAKDATEIGIRGVNLSGGQKQRVALCRAVYNDSDIYLLDDPLSAVDANVGAHIFYKCLHGKLKNKTRVLVTNQVYFLNQCDYIYCLDEGKLVEQGNFEDLMQKDQYTHVRALVQSYLDSVNAESDVKLTVDELISSGDSERLLLQRQRSASLGNTGESKTAPGKQFKGDMMRKDIGAGGGIIDEEEMFEGRVSYGTYGVHLVRLGGAKYLVWFFLSVAVQQLLSVYPTFLIGAWAKNSFNQPHSFYLNLLTMIMAATGLALLGRGISWAYACKRSSYEYHKNTLDSVLRAPSTFFDATPIGRVLNRFASDMKGVDSQLNNSMLFVVIMSFYCIGSLFAVVVVTPWFLFAIAFGFGMFMWIQMQHSSTAVGLQRLESVARSPVYDHFSETLRGLSTVRAFQLSDRFAVDSTNKLNKYIHTYFVHLVLFNWVRLRTSALQSILVFVATALIVSQPDEIDSALAGAALIFTFGLGGLMNFLVLMLTDLQSKLNVVERLEYYSNEIEPEPAWESDVVLPAQWPEQGSVSFKKVTMKYRPGLEPAIQNVSFAFNPGEKIGIAGRTGSGKSTVMLTLMRMYELDKGSIFIDGVDIGTLGLHQLRRGVAIIPQDPIMFSGNIRKNLDPFNAYNDEDIMGALQDVQLEQYVKDLPNGLDSEVLEYGANLSAGQRQLICIARVILKKPKILLMDEATSSIDQGTDSIVQDVIREKFANSTVITIAHRLNTIMDSDRILILDKGQVVEFDTPATLMNVEGGVFAEMFHRTTQGAKSSYETKSNSSSPLTSTTSVATVATATATAVVEEETPEVATTVAIEDSYAAAHTAVFGADKRGWNEAWLQQGFEFSERKTEVEGEHAPVTESFRYGFEQHKGGSCGVLAVVQAHVVANLLFKGAAETSSASALLDAADDQRAAALGQALADVLWKSSDGKQATVVSAPAECKFQAANLKTLLTATLLTSKEATVAFFKANLARFQSHGGVVLFLYSVILTRGVDNIAADQDTPGPLMGAHAYCSQDMVNLLLSGKAVTNVFDGEQKLDSTTLSGFTEQQEVGFLTLFEHHQHMTVGENLKNPVYPVWVVNSESHYTLLFALEPLTAEATSVNLLHFDQLGKQTDEYKLTVDTSSEQPAERDEELEPPINDVVRTRWGANATIDWNGAEAPL